VPLGLVEPAARAADARPPLDPDDGVAARLDAAALGLDPTAPGLDPPAVALDPPAVALDPPAVALDPPVLAAAEPPLAAPVPLLEEAGRLELVVPAGLDVDPELVRAEPVAPGLPAGVDRRERLLTVSLQKATAARGGPSVVAGRFAGARRSGFAQIRANAGPREAREQEDTQDEHEDGRGP
jgi:hypothetical protein